MSNVGRSSLGDVFPQRMAPGGGPPQAGSGNPVIVRPTASGIVATGTVILSKQQGANKPVWVQVNRWESGDPKTARPVRITITGSLVQNGVNGYSSAQLAYVEVGSQTGGQWTMYVPVPCDFRVSATFINVKAAIVGRPVTIPPGVFPDVETGRAFQQYCNCSIAEGDSGELQVTTIGANSGVQPHPGYGTLSPQQASFYAPAIQTPTQNNVRVTEFIVTNTGSTGMYVGLLDRPYDWTPVPVVDPVNNDTFFDHETPLWVPGNSTVSQSFDGGKACFLGVAYCATQKPWSNVGFDTVNYVNLIVEARGVIFPATYGAT